MLRDCCADGGFCLGFSIDILNGKDFSRNNTTLKIAKLKGFAFYLLMNQSSNRL